MTDILLDRFSYHKEGTLGVIHLEDQVFWTIERPWVNNERNISCIPEGTYSMNWRESPRFGWTWELEDVPDRSYILIHPGNFASNFEGCIGLGMGLMGDRTAVSRSRDAVTKFDEMTEGGQWFMKIAFRKFAAL